MRDSDVRNRRLFNRQKEVAARNKVRELGGVTPMMATPNEPSGILASSPELMEAAMTAMPIKETGQGKIQPVAASPVTGTTPVPAPTPGAPMGGIASLPQAPKPQGQKVDINVRQQGSRPPIKMQAGGDLGLHMMGRQMGIDARNGAMPTQVAKEVDPMQALFMQGQQMAGKPVSIMSRPKPDPISVLESSGFSEEDIRADKKLINLAQEMTKDPADKAKLLNLDSALSSPDATNKQKTKAIADTFGVEPTTEGLQKVDKLLSPDPKKKSSNRVDTLIKAITQNALGGAIGGPNSVAARVSNAIGKGLDAALLVEREREKALNDFMTAAIGDRPEYYQDNAVKRKSKELDFEYYEYQPTKAGIDAGNQSVVMDDETLISVYNNKRDSIDSNLNAIGEAMTLLEEGGVAGYQGVIGRTRDSLRGLPGAESFLGEGLSKATKYDQVLRVLAAQLAPELLGESGRTISDGDRARVAQMLGFAVTDNQNGTFTVGNFVGRGFKTDEELMSQMKKIDDLLRGKAKKIDNEFYSIAKRMPGVDIKRPEEQTAPAQTNPNVIQMTEEEMETYSNPKKT